MLLQRTERVKINCRMGYHKDQKPLIYSQPVAWMDSTPGAGICCGGGTASPQSPATAR
jgi:hypothetical protein